MIDICTVIYRNYDLLDLQVDQWSRINGEHRLIVLDNTPAGERCQVNYPIHTLDVYGSDGETHGAALDRLVQLAETDIVGVVDSDFFWLNKDIIHLVEDLFAQGYKCVGAAAYYQDWFNNIDTRRPDHNGKLAPICYGMFIDRKLAAEQTFICTYNEGSNYLYTGWRLRERIIKESIPAVTFQGIDGNDCCLFTYNDKIQGLHVLKGSFTRSNLTSSLPEKISYYSDK